MNHYVNQLNNNENAKHLQKVKRIEQHFPFYLIDIDEFMHTFYRAKTLTFLHSRDSKPVWDINYLSLKALQEAFKKNKIWSEAL